MRIEEITTSKQLYTIKDEWAKLCVISPSTTPFQTPHWLLPWWDIFGGSTLKCVVIRDSDMIVGLGLFFIYKVPSNEKRKLCFLGTGISDYLNIITYPGLEAQCVCMIIDYLVSISDEWDECDLQDISQTNTLLLNFAIPNTLIVEKTISNICLYLMLPSSLNLFEKNLKKKLRQNIHRAQHELTTLGNVSLEKANSNNSESFLNSFFKLQHDRWKSRDKNTVLQNKSLCTFYRTVASNLVYDSLVDLYTLRVDNTDIASYYILQKGSACYAYLGGFDPAFQQYSPGTVALFNIIRNSIVCGAKLFDFMRGAEQYKYHWKPFTNINYRLRIIKK